MRKIISFCFLLTISSITNAQVTRNGTDSVKQVVATITELVKQPLDSNILIVVDGIISGTYRELKKDITKVFPADMIHSIEILKGYRATEKYGDKGKAGVLEFYLKDVKITDLSLQDVTKKSDSVFKKVEIEAAFPGGNQTWRSYLERNLNGNVPYENHAPSGTYTVIVMFIVEKTGEISEIKPLTNHGYGMEDEVIRVISKGPNWLSAVQDGRKVRAYRKQPVTFSVIKDFELSTYTITAGTSSTIEITVDRLGITGEDIDVTISYGTIRFENGDKFIISVDKPGRVILSVKKKAKKKKDEEDFGTVAIEVK